MTIEITREIAQHVLQVVDCGLTSGIGDPIPGQMCVEAAVCFALGLAHNDDPKCVAGALRNFKISLNDARWSSREVRARGLRRLALAQLGSLGYIDDAAFVERLMALAIDGYGAKTSEDPEGDSFLDRARNRSRDQFYGRAAEDLCSAMCEKNRSIEDGAAVYDAHLSHIAEDVVQILIDMNAPGAQWLDLTEEPK